MVAHNLGNTQRQQRGAGIACSVAAVLKKTVARGRSSKREEEKERWGSRCLAEQTDLVQPQGPGCSVFPNNPGQPQKVCFVKKSAIFSMCTQRKGFGRIVRTGPSLQGSPEIGDKNGTRLGGRGKGKGTHSGNHRIHERHHLFAALPADKTKVQKLAGLLQLRALFVIAMFVLLPGSSEVT